MKLSKKVIVLTLTSLFVITGASYGASAYLKGATSVASTSNTPVKSADTSNDGLKPVATVEVNTETPTPVVAPTEQTLPVQPVAEQPHKLSNNEVIVMAQSLGMFQLPTYAYTEWPEKFYSDNALDSMTKIKQMCERLGTPTCMTSFTTTRGILKHEGKMDLSLSDKWDFVINYSY